MYQKAPDFADKISNQVITFPKHEINQLAGQFIRAADFIANNITEG